MEKTNMNADRRTAVITGGSSGIGLAAARALAERGFDLLICSRNEITLATAVEGLKHFKTKVYGYTCDVSREADVADLATAAERHLGHVDLLFNNAGTGKFVSLADTSLELWQDTIAASLTGTFLCCRAMLPLLLKSQTPVIINNASVAAHRGFPNNGAYSAAKGGVAAFSRAIREELRPTGIRVTTLYPGATDSAFWDAVEGEWDRSRMMKCEDIGKLIVQIAETSACAMVEEIYLMPAGGAL